MQEKNCYVDNIPIGVLNMEIALRIFLMFLGIQESNIVQNNVRGKFLKTTRI